jgi:hypothetical protein
MKAPGSAGGRFALKAMLSTGKAGGFYVELIHEQAHVANGAGQRRNSTLSRNG